MDDADVNALPPGWEMKYDRRSGKHYYMNYLTKMTSWEDPRIRNKSQGTPQHYPVDFVSQQSGHGSPYHVYPYPSPIPLQHAFQHSSYPPSNLQSSFSPKALPRQITELGKRSYGSPLSGGSPILGRSVNFTPRGSPQLARVSYPTNKEAPISLATDVDASVSKISSMFPTVSETHIRILLKKYYNREAVVISALQVEKHPISTPGPFSTPPSGVSRLQSAASGICAGVQFIKGASPTPPYGASPRASPPLRPQSGASGTGSPLPAPIPHSSPKMKLRYLKSLFPKAEETLILDVLASEDNNVQKASEKLITMGYSKKESHPPKPAVVQQKDEPKSSSRSSTPPRLKSMEEKQALKARLQKKYSSIPERVVSIALESVNWSEDRAEQILSVVLQEDVISQKTKELSIKQEPEVQLEDKNDATSRNKVGALPSLTPSHTATQLNVADPTPDTICVSDKSNRRYKNKKEATKLKTQVSPERIKQHQSHYVTKAKGPSSLNVKGAQDHLLLVDYITWNGANPDLKTGSRKLYKGPMKITNENAVTTLSRGPNKDNCKGPSVLPKGSLYQHIKPNFSQMKVGGE